MNYLIYFDPYFVRQYKKLTPDIQHIVKNKIELLKDKTNHELLKVHKLHGRLSEFYSFSVTYSLRIVFGYTNITEINILKVGSHDVYK